MALVGVVAGHTIMATSIITDDVFQWGNLLDYLGLARGPGEPHFLALSIVQVMLMALLVSVLFVSLRPLENDPLPLWDGRSVERAGVRSATVGNLQCDAGAATLASVGWGLKELGLYCIAVMLAALVGARLLARDVPAPKARTPATRAVVG